MAGCAPCQPFSSYSQSARRDGPHEDWELLSSFLRSRSCCAADACDDGERPPASQAADLRGFRSRFAERLLFRGFRLGGRSWHRSPATEAATGAGGILPRTDQDYRKPVMPTVTVRDTISDLPPIEAGTADPNDPLHASSSLSELNLARIRHSKPGGTWRDWPEELVAKCHTRQTGSTYPSVYGRMEWDQPAPTMTTQFFGFGNGRFGHPDQDRAISLREAAMLQEFPQGLCVRAGRCGHQLQDTWTVDR